MALAEQIPPPPSTLGSKPGENVQRHWWDDVDTLARVKRVRSLTEQGLFAEKISRMLKVHVRTVHEDRARYLELAREDIKTDVKSHIARLQQVIDEASIAFHALGATNTFAIKRSDYLNIIRQAQMDIAKLDGSLAADRIQIGVAVQVGPAPIELYQQGKISDQDYEAVLRATALQSGARMIEGDVLEPAAEEPDQGASPPPSPVLRRRDPSSSPTPREVSQEASPASPSSDLEASGLVAFSEEPDDEPALTDPEEDDEE